MFKAKYKQNARVVSNSSATKLLYYLCSSGRYQFLVRLYLW